MSRYAIIHGRIYYDKDELLEVLGMDRRDLEDFAEFLFWDELEDLRHSATVASEEAGYYEESCDSLQNCLSSLANSIGELLSHTDGKQVSAGSTVRSANG